MKILFLSVCLFVFASSLRAQNQKTFIYCTLDASGRTDYGDLNKLLPDSLKTILIDPRKDDNIRSLSHVLLFMGLNGWKLVSIDANVTGGGMVSSTSTYYLSKEIYLDAAAHALFMQNLLNNGKKK